MACSNCGTDSGGGGCGKSGGCSSGGCNKMNSFDWLADMELMDLPVFNIVEVRFKGGRKEFFKNTEHLELFIGDPIVVEVQGGHHIGYVSLQGELVRLQMRKRNVVDNDEVKKIYRKATEKDLEKFEQARNREAGTLFRTRNVINQLKLGMKLSDVEYQADNTKASFYYSAEDRVDFRELIKSLATEFKIRVEMKQISLRQEAGRLGGIGSCGRELCCSTWLVDFKNVSTSAARYQNLSLNPAKLSGQCGRLKCCLNYELDTYMEALKEIPEVEKPLKTQKGEAFLQKTDIFRKIMWFGFKDTTEWYQISIDRVNFILQQNKQGILPASLEVDTVENLEEDKAKKDKELARFDDKFKKNSNNNRNKPRRPNTPNNSSNETRNIKPRENQVDNNNATGSAEQDKNKNQQNNNRQNSRPPNSKPNPNQNPNNIRPNPNANANPNTNPNSNPNLNMNSKPNAEAASNNSTEQPNADQKPKNNNNNKNRNRRFNKNNNNNSDKPIDKPPVQP